MSFQNSGMFSSNVGIIQVFSQEEFNSVGLEKPKELSKIPRILGGFERGFYVSGFCLEKRCSNLSTKEVSSNREGFK